MKKIKFIQVNIFRGKYLNDLIDFLKWEDPDFIAMQEVTTYGFNLSGDKTLDLFEFLKKRLAMTGAYNGDLKLKSDSRSRFGNALLSKHEIIKTNTIALKNFRPVTLEELDGVNAAEIRPLISRNLLSAVVKIEEKEINLMSWHGAWTAPPTDTFETMRQAKMVAEYIESLDSPFLLGGDLNNVPNSRTVGLINRVANNLMDFGKIKQTTHPKVHKIVPRGFLVDYIFTSKHFTVEKLTVPEITVSDHLPIVAELELNYQPDGLPYAP